MNNLLINNLRSILLFFTILISLPVLNAKVLCEGDCYNVKPKTRQEVIQKNQSAINSGQETPNQPSQQKESLMPDGKMYGKKYVLQKYFNLSKNIDSETDTDIENHTDTENHIENNNELKTEQKTEYNTGYELLPNEASNIPEYFSKLKASDVENHFVILSKSEAKKKLDGLFPGSVLKIVIKQDIVASNKVSTPVVGTVVSGQYQGSRIYGEATLDDELKRILFNFKSLSGGHLTNEYVIKASGLDILGRVGIKGLYHADDISFGIASFFATATAIAADSQVERSKAQNGEYIENPSADNSAKKGISGAIGKVAERLANRAMSSPGRTEVEGPLLIQLILDEAPYFKR